MKYTSLDPVKEKKLHIGPFKGGINLNTPPLQLDSNSLSECKNMLYYNGVLKTRPGISACLSDKIECEHTADSFYGTYKVENNLFYIDGYEKRIITETLEMDMSTYYLNVYFTDKERNTAFAGSLCFKRTSDSIFYIPYNTVFFQAKPQMADGIYAFVSLLNCEDGESMLYKIYELDINRCEWIKTEDYYIPTVYINGRGNQYEYAQQASNYVSQKPMLLEKPNLLSGKFTAYYSSDGYSSSFVLPYNKLTDDEVTCRIYYSLTDFTDWVAGIGEEAVTNEFLGSKVTMNIDRSKGIIYFTVDSTDYSVPYMSKFKLNNIRITATMQTGDSFADVVSCTCSTVTDSRLLLSGGKLKNRIFYASLENPLYFPKSEVAEAGDCFTSVTAFYGFKDKTVIFKPDEIYLLSFKKGGLLNTAAMLADNNSDFYDVDRIEVKRISNSFGCSSLRSVTSFFGNIVFFATDGRLYSITDSGSIKHLSAKTDGYFKDTPDYVRDECVLLSDNEYCYLFLRNTAFVIKPGSDLSNDKTVWFYWEFPESITVQDGIDCDYSPILLCTNSLTCYTAVLGGEKDVLLSNVETYKQIKSRFKTAHFSPCGLENIIRLKRICLNYSDTGNTDILINGKAVELSNTDTANLSRITVFPEEYSVKEVYITMQSDGNLSVYDGDIFYE